MKLNQSILQLTQKTLAEVKVDIDTDYCKKYGIKYVNHEIDANEVSLFNSKSTKADFDLVFKNR